MADSGKMASKIIAITSKNRISLKIEFNDHYTGRPNK